MRIVHLTECLATGVLDVVRLMAIHQASLGHTVVVYHVPHRDTPDTDILDAAFDGIPVRAIGRADRSRAVRMIALLKCVMQARRGNWDVIHLHSSFAGAVGRLILGRGRAIYSPHGYAFLRGDVAPILSKVYASMEWLLARRSSPTICVSHDELAVAQTRLAVFGVSVPNVLQRADVENAIDTYPGPRSRPKVVNVGRWTAQKGPELFARAATAYGSRAEFLWVGPGEDDPEKRWYATGWVSQGDVWKDLRSASLMFFTSRWEGMPIGLMRAQAIGVPVVARHCVGVENVVEDGVTGWIARDDDHAMELLEWALDNPAAVAEASTRAFERRHRLMDENYGSRVLAAYETLLRRGGSQA